MNTPQAFYIPNHSASDLHKADLASLPSLSVRPKFSSKDEYAKWCHDATTEHVFYVLYEPEFPGSRSNANNPIKFMHGVVADYDGDAAVVQAALAELKFGPGKAPTWVTTTYSGKARLIWAFEKPVPVFSPDVHGRLLAALKKHLKLTGILPGLDEGAYINAHTPFELGTDWRQPYGDVRLPHNEIMLFLHDACEKTKWKSDGPEIPMEAVEAEVNKRWPGRWTGPFVEGARGIRFWDTRADNPTGCTIRSTGVQAWTGEAKFIPWHELLGSEFVKQYRANRIGGAIDGTYFDGHSYWRRDETGIWRDLTPEGVKRHLNVDYGLSAESKKGQASEVSQALVTVDKLQRIDGAFPCLFMRDDIVRDSGQKYLNIARAKPIAAVVGARQWDEGFPWLAKYLDGLFGEEQKAVFLSWLSHFYRNASAGTPKKGHALFVSGPQSAGKTFLSHCVIGRLMGGIQEATSYILGDTNFNEQLFHAPVWAVDDAVAGADPKRHSTYSQIVKKIVANPYQEYHAKFKKAVTFRWNGRLVVTLNDDPTSIAMIPNIDVSNRDKVILLKADRPQVSFEDAERTVNEELPSFASYLNNFEIPAHLRKSTSDVTRFGHDAWHHPELLECADDASPGSGVKEILDMWRRSRFAEGSDPYWRGSPLALLGELKNAESVKGLVPDVIKSHVGLGRHLRGLMSKGVDWIAFERTAVSRLYRIARPADLPVAPQACRGRTRLGPPR